MSNLFELLEIEDHNSSEHVQTCNTCKIVKSLSSFSKNRKKCKECASVQWKIYYEKNSDRLKKKHSERRNDERSDEQKKLYLEEKKYKEELYLLQEQGKRRCRICDEIKVLDEFPNDFSSRVFFNKKSYCKPCAHTKWRVPRSKTAEYKMKKSISDKKYREKPQVIERINERSRERYYNDIHYKLKLSIRNRVNKVIKTKNQKKLGSFVTNLGCTVEELITHLESKFYANPETGEMMSWKNHSKKGWHIDHIKPLSSFNLEDPKQFKEACDYRNLQPLWWKENLSKGNKI